MPIADTLQKNFKILLFVIAGLILIVIGLIIFRPKQPQANPAYQSQIDSLNHEIAVLHDAQRILLEQAKQKDVVIAQQQSRDSLLLIKYLTNSIQLNALKKQHDKNISHIDSLGTDGIKRAFSDLQW